MTRSHFSAQTILSLAASMTNHIPARKSGHEGQEGRRQTKILPPSHQARLFPLRRSCEAFSGPSLYSASDPDFGSWHCFQIQSMLSLLAHLWPMNLQKLAQPCQLLELQRITGCLHGILQWPAQMFTSVVGVFTGTSHKAELLTHSWRLLQGNDMVAEYPHKTQSSVSKFSV